AIAGVLGAYLITYPRANVHTLVWIVIFFWVVTVPAWILLGLWFAMQLVSGLGVRPGSPGVAFWAHVGGFATGVLLYLLLRPPPASAGAVSSGWLTRGSFARCGPAWKRMIASRACGPPPPSAGPANRPSRCRPVCARSIGPAAGSDPASASGGLPVRAA